MPDDSPILSLPYILPAQAQKHVTHNEALRKLDAIVQLVVQDRTRVAPPASPVEGDRHIIAAGAGGPWAGQSGRVALFQDGDWAFLTPLAGWRAYVLDEGAMAVWDGLTWHTQAEGPLEVQGLGISTTPDTINRLSVNAPATLLNHAGAGHQLKINKAGVTDTASLLFQTGFSGRAEMGLAGTDDFAIKVSATGGGFVTGLSVAAATGAVSVPFGVLAADGGAAAPGYGFAAEAGLGLARIAPAGLGLVTGGVLRAQLSSSGLSVSVPITGTAVVQSTSDVTSGRLLRTGTGVAQAYRTGNVVGAVGQTGGVPTGAVIERGSNANGEFIRLADGTQFCYGAINTSSSAAVTWTYPAAFFVTPKVLASVAAGASRQVTWQARGNTSVDWNAFDLSGARTAATLDVVVVGRWF